MKYLPKACSRFTVIGLLVTCYLLLVTFVNPVFAQVRLEDPKVSADEWVEDSEVTFAGKIAARARDLLNSSIENYQWAHLEPPKNLPALQGEKNPFNAIWITFRNIVYALLSLFILAGAFLLIITRGQSITVKKFIPRFILIIILVTLSFSLIKFLYDVTDILQGFFIKNPQGEVISTKDLLHVSFKYDEFVGLRNTTLGNEESAFISLLLVKLTAATYYVMFIVLTIRKIILWFFIIVSPIFPLLLFFSPIRNTAKIWIGEFFRWLLYAPLFAIFLSGLVALWQIYIPIKTPNLPCEKEVEERIYPTSINILLGGPCQKLNPDGNTDVEAFNNLNNTDSFMQYLVSLLMLWMVIIMPFILLKIFLDYLKEFSLGGDEGLLKFMLASRPKIKPPPPLPKAPPHFIPPPIPVAPTITPSAQAGLARELSRAADLTRSLSHLKPQLAGNLATQKSISQILDMTNLRIPTIREIARYEAGGEEVSKLTEALNRLSGTSALLSPQEKEQFASLRVRISQELEGGNPVASSIMEATKKAEDVNLPEENKLQTVNLEDYEEVKKTWMENYRNLEPPLGDDGQPMEREQWLKKEIGQIPVATNLLLAQERQKVNQGKQMVSKILPFLLLGGFSKTEVISYLKAKSEAAKQVLDELAKEEKEEGEKVYVERKTKEKPKSMTAEAEIPQDKKTSTS